VRAHDQSITVVVEVERWFVMKRSYFALLAAFALLVPTLASAQVKTVYIPGAHPRVVVVQTDNATPAPKVEKAPLTPAQIIALHEPMANAALIANRVNYSAVAHCDRLVTQARADLRKNF
jgi:hypothetical protein